MYRIILIITTALTLSFIVGCKQEAIVVAEQWSETEIVFTSDKQVKNPYTDIEFWVEFTGPSGEKLSRPGFWDGGNTFRVRFANPLDKGEWQWISFASDTTDIGVHGKTGKLLSALYSGNNPLIKNGLLCMSPGKRNVVHANGKSFLMIGDTPWALPWRGTTESVTEYAKKRHSQGFNTALLMSLQPDREAMGPRNRTDEGAFDVAFEDLKDGHINNPNVAYFQYFDSLRNILIDHGIVPVFQPVFHGFGWKGMKVLGWDMDAKEYARYCRYLVARYGAKPAMWLVGADADGRNTGVKVGGEEIEKWDAYKQPTGLHYSPFDDRTPEWLKDVGGKYEPHMNRSFQDAVWLDFQWCQTGHSGEHLFHKVGLMYNNIPVKAVANGEPTYEGISRPENGSGWWQGHEAWSQFLSGGTMGVVYGAGSLWNWKLSANEPGWAGWANSNVSWKEALQLPGANYVGYLAKALEGLKITDIEKHPELAGGNLCLARPGELYLVYLPEGGEVTLSGLPKDLVFRWFNPIEGAFFAQGNTTAVQKFSAEKGKPAVLIVSTLLIK